MKRIVICGSMKLVHKMCEVEGVLKERGFEVVIPKNFEARDERLGNGEKVRRNHTCIFVANETNMQV